MAINRKIKTYYAYWFNEPILAGATLLPNLTLQNAKRNFYLTKVVADLDILNSGTSRRIPWEINTTIRFYMNIYQAGTQSINKTFISTWPPAPRPDNTLYIFNPGKYYYSGIYFINDILVEIRIINYDAVNAHRIFLGLTFEVEEV